MPTTAELLRFLPDLLPGTLLMFLKRRDDQVPIAEFEGHDDVRTAFHGVIADIAGYDVDTISGAPAIILRRVDGKPSPLLGHWTGIGDYTRNVQHVIDQLIPTNWTIKLERDWRGRSVATIGHPGHGIIYSHGPCGGATPARALLMTWLTAL